MVQWADLEFKEQMFQNIDEAIVSRAMVLVENAYSNQAGGYSRFPGLVDFVTLPGQRTFVYGWREDLIAVTDLGQIYRISKAGAVQNLTGVPISGGRRPVFSSTEDEMVIAAGGPIIRVAKSRSERLSDDAPESTHVAFIEGYLVAIEPFSGRFWHSEVGQYRTWDRLSVFTAEGKPDDLNACIVTPFNELLLCGKDSIEQFETLANGDRPFYRRWGTGEGLGEPYTLVADPSGTFGLNASREFVRFQAQVTREEGEQVAAVLERIEDWRDAWATSVSISGERFIILQAPHAPSVYGTAGITLLFDYRRRRWSYLFGWDEDIGAPTRWPGWSYAAVHGRHYVGVPGGVAMLRSDATANLAMPMRSIVRTGHLDKFGASRIDGLRLRFKRGTGPYQGDEPVIGVRAIRDGGDPSAWVFRGVGRPGHDESVLDFGAFGVADTWQFEVAMTDAADYQFARGQVYVERLKR